MKIENLKFQVFSDKSNNGSKISTNTILESQWKCYKCPITQII